MACLIRNSSNGPLTLPFPYGGIIRPGGSQVVSGTAAAVGPILGHPDNLRGSGVTLTDVPDSQLLNSPTGGADAVAAQATLAAHVARLYLFTDPATASATAVHAAFAGDDEASDFPGAFTNPATPRNVTATFGATWDGGDVTVVGTNQFDEATVETLAANAGGSTAGTKVFKTVTSATKGAVGEASGTASIGTGTKIGIPAVVKDAFGVLLVNDVAEAVAVDATYSAFTPTTAPNGARDFKLLVNV